MMRDPFEAAIEAELQYSPPESPAAAPPTDDFAAASVHEGFAGHGDGPRAPGSSTPAGVSGTHSGTPGGAAPGSAGGGEAVRGKEDDEDEEEEDNVDVDLGRFPSNDPEQLARMNAILAQFTKEQMERYESYRRSNLQRSNMRRLLTNITGSQKISMPITIVVCGIAKMLVGDLVEIGRIVMSERKESGPLRPCHIREAYRRLKLEGKIPKRSVPRLFH